MNNFLPGSGRTSGISDEMRLAGVAFEGDALVARFLNGSIISVDLNHYPRLQQATPFQRKKWRLIGKGLGVHWENLDEDLSVQGIVEGRLGLE